VSPRLRSLPSIPPAQLRALRNRLKLSVRDAGLTDLNPAQGSSNAEFWTLEPTPLVISPGEWSLLESALCQRARLINAYLSDLYGKQEALRAGIIPADITLADPYYRRPSIGISPRSADPACLIRFDLIKTATGWAFLDTHANAPVGLSYAIQNRRFLTQEASDYYRALPDYRSIINFPLQLVDALQSLIPAFDRQPSMVFLTAGPRYPFYSEHSFLARKMGLRLAQGDDLLVIDNHVFFKTVAGLERVDVIYRRLNDAHIDPVVFSTSRESAGIPGLMQCIRAGNVVVANAIGAGVAENRALHTFLPRLARFYFNERLELPAVPTFLCSDNDQIDQVFENPELFEILPTHSPRADQPVAPSLMIKGGKLPAAVRETPHAFVAQSRLTPLSLHASSRKHIPFRFSAFVITNGRSTAALPGGIVSIGADQSPPDRVGTTADAIVLVGDAATAGSLSDFETNVSAGAESVVPSSRAAESLFWLGRYLERAESTARMLHILDDVVLEEIPSSDRRRWLPLWRGLLEATGHANLRITARVDPRTTLTSDLIWRMTLGGNHPSSLLNSVSAANANARELREFVSPEAGNLLNRVHTTLANLAKQSPTARNRFARESRLKASAAAIRAVLDSVNACLGAAARTMLHDAGWHFMQLGMQLERAAVTAGTLRHVLTAASTEATSEDSPAATLHFRDNPELSALLRMLGSQDAYRRLFRTRSQPLFVAQLFLQQPHAPHSILHNLQKIMVSHDAIQELTDDDQADPLGELLASTIAELSGLNLGRHFDPDAASTHGAPTLEETVVHVLDRLDSVNQLLGDHYFSHQARIASGVVQAELQLQRGQR
jgi:uncharacterized circularly permuted ATP-grasp superfamily protein/uncharacterized alpha-E superfamily protein